MQQPLLQECLQSLRLAQTADAATTAAARVPVGVAKVVAAALATPCRPALMEEAARALDGEVRAVVVAKAPATEAARLPP